MVNIAHLKVVLRKDYLILKRRRGFCFALLFIPPLLAFLAIMPTILQNKSPPTFSGSMFWDNFKETGNFILTERDETTGKFEGLPPFVNRTSLLTKCVFAKNEKQNFFDKVAIIAPNTNVNARAKIFFSGYFLKFTGLNELGIKTRPANSNFTVDMFNSKQDFEKKLSETGNKGR